MKTTTLKRTGNLIITIFFTFLTFGMLQGFVQNTIPFLSELNEIGFTLFSFFLTLIFGFLTVNE